MSRIALWDETQIIEARQLLERALALHGAGPSVLQAAIADLHIHERREWEQIALLYRRLEELTGSPVVTVNRAVALAEIEGPAVALALLDDLGLGSYQYFHSTRADLLRRLGRNDQARAAYARALSWRRQSPSGGSSNHGCTNSTPAAATQARKLEPTTVPPAPSLTREREGADLSVCAGAVRQ